VVPPFSTPKDFLDFRAGTLPAINSPRTALTVRPGHGDQLLGNYGVARRVKPEAKFFNNFSRARACGCADGRSRSAITSAPSRPMIFCRSRRGRGAWDRRVEPEAKFFNDFSRACACAQGGVHSESVGAVDPVLESRVWFLGLPFFVGHGARPTIKLLSGKGLSRCVVPVAVSATVARPWCDPWGVE
jgi:hypothetical protein